jgi:hypothetical protein
MGLAGHPWVVRHGVDHVDVLARRVNAYRRVWRASMDYVWAMRAVRLSSVTTAWSLDGPAE